jgi:hypothetical protein
VTFGFPPTDPVYLAFLAGLKAVAANPTGQANERWHPPRNNWVSYDPAKWGMEDVGVITTPPGMAISNWAWGGSSWTVNELAVPGLFAELSSYYGRLQAWHPGGNFVWSPWGGTWRNAFERSVPPKPPPVIHQRPRGDPPTPAKEKIAYLEEMGRRGSITHALEQAEIRRILDEYL